MGYNTDAGFEDGFDMRRGGIDNPVVSGTLLSFPVTSTAPKPSSLVFPQPGMAGPGTGTGEQWQVSRL